MKRLRDWWLRIFREERQESDDLKRERAERELRQIRREIEALQLIRHRQGRTRG